MLRNRKAEAATGVWGIVTADSPDVELFDAVVAWPDIPGNATAGSQAPHLTFRVKQGCGQNLRFKLKVFSGDGRTSFAGFNVRVEGSGGVQSTEPRAGERVAKGRVIRVVAGVGR